MNLPPYGIDLAQGLPWLRVSHHGWISLSLGVGYDSDEIEALLLMSYRHFALKRMLKALEASQAKGLCPAARA